ncbi:MAG: hypothetical protein CVT95_04640 [Bacteroidetes bacterium HGW-Bacteroidetes-12]|nr:MAG: hypothetical protein CVT95_04640 [Bacteroidetes bacterium HGW-Bacteroidetes-12]
MFLLCSLISFSQSNEVKDSLTDSVSSIHLSDSMISKDALGSKLQYKASDSIRYDMKNKLVYLFGKVEVYYEDIELKAEEIEINLDSNLVMARGKQDSTGKFFGEPVMKEAGKEFQAHDIKYNFNTKRGIITEVMTHEGESYIHGKKVYKSPDNVMYIRNGKYTTCNAAHPHYYFSSAKLKIIPKDKIVTGPANLVIEDVPTPIGIPFGFFPNTDKQQSGILIPTPGESGQFGFFLLGGGYYWGVSEKLSMQLTGDIYSKGSWGSNFISNYNNRYRFNGNLDVRYSIFKNGIEGLPTFSERKDFFIRWNHSQDPKARPNSNFSANVNFGTSQNFTNNFNSSAQDFLSATFNSTISYKKTWDEKPFNLSINGFHSQNNVSKSVTVRLPEIAFNVSRLQPLKTKTTGKRNDLLDNFGMSYSMNFKNEVTAGDSLFSLNNLDVLTGEFRNGMRHAIPISTSMKVLKYFTINPSFNYSELWYIESVEKKWDNSINELVVDTVNGFVRANSYDMNVTLTTKMYGMYQYKGKMIKALRHVITPSIGLSYIPENNQGLKSYIDSTNNRFEYSIFENGIYGTTSRQEAGNINLGLLNNFEMKVRNRKDSLGDDKKIKLLENLGFRSSYNMIADSLRWSNISIDARTNIFRVISLNYNAQLDPYQLDSLGRKINLFEVNSTGKIGRLVSSNLAIGFTLKSKQSTTTEKKSDFGTEQELAYIRANPEAFIDFNVPWTLNVNYNIRYSKPQFVSTTVQTLNFSGDLSLTQKWKIGMTSGYDFQAKDFTYTTVDIYRDLHCWEMSFNWVPFGIRQSYLFTIKIKSAILQDLKMTRRSVPNVF